MTSLLIAAILLLISGTFMILSMRKDRKNSRVFSLVASALLGAVIVVIAIDLFT